MISNQILQSAIDGMKAITNAQFTILDVDGKVQASTKDARDTYKSLFQTAKAFAADIYVAQNLYFFKVYDEHRLEYILVVDTESSEGLTIGKMAAFQIQGLLVAYKERFDKDNFYKNLLLDNLLLVDIYNRAKKLHIDTEAKRVIFIVEMPEGKEALLLEKVRAVLGAKTKDFITVVDEKHVIVIREVGNQTKYQVVDEYAEHLHKILATTGETGFHIAYGTIGNDIKEVSKSYKEAKLALDVGKIFFGENDVIAYNTLGIGRLIYQLPIPLCKMFIREIFEGKSPDDFDEETLMTIDKFFENSLNVSETSRQLFIHRNTLVYRLDKIQKLTGLDLRVFEDAITFKIALMVVKYMKYMETMEY